MKHLAAVAILVAFSASPVLAQRGGGSHGGFSGSHGGFSGSHSGGASGFHSGSGGFSHSGSSGFRGSPAGRIGAPPSARFAALPPARFGSPSARFAGPTHYISNRMPYRGFAPRSASPRASYSGSMHRMPYDGHQGGNGWDHGGRGRGRNHFGFGFYGWPGYAYSPWWGWGYPYLFNDWDYWDNFEAQPGYDGSQSYAQPYPDYMPGPYDQLPDQGEPQAPPPAAQPQPAPSSAPVPPAPAPLTTLVFKDGRPNEQIHNYLLTPSTLSVLDAHRRDIPVDQIDVAATTNLNRESGIEFSLPRNTR